MNIGIYAGSFDPITKGHIDVIKKAASFFDILYIAVGNNPLKKHTFNLGYRFDMVSSCIKDLNKIKVVQLNSSVAQFCRTYNCSHIVRGLRNVTDYLYEMRLAEINKHFAPNTNTIFFIPDTENQLISSSMVKEMYSLGEDVSEYVTPYVMEILKNCQ